MGNIESDMDRADFEFDPRYLDAPKEEAEAKNLLSGLIHRVSQNVRTEINKVLGRHKKAVKSRLKFERPKGIKKKDPEYEEMERRARLGAFSMYRKFELENPDKSRFEPILSKAGFSPTDMDIDEAKVSFFCLERFAINRDAKLRKENSGMDQTDRYNAVKKELEDAADKVKGEMDAAKTEPADVEKYKDLADTFSESNEDSLTDRFSDLEGLKVDLENAAITIGEKLDEALKRSVRETDVKDKEADKEDLRQQLNSAYSAKPSNSAMVASLKSEFDKVKNELHFLRKLLEYKEAAKELRKELQQHCDTFLKAFKDKKLEPGKDNVPTEKEIEDLKNKLKGLSFSKGQDHDDLKKSWENNDKLKQHFQTVRSYLENKMKGAEATNTKRAKRLIEELLKMQSPGMSDKEAKDRATLILVENVDLLNTSKTYEALAEEAGPEKLKVAALVKLKRHLLDFRYKTPGEEDIKTPFEGFEIGDFKTPESIDNLFASGKINLENGFFVLAALKRADTKNKKNAQAIKVERGLRRLLMKELEAEEDASSNQKIRELVNEAFNERLYDAEKAFNFCSKKIENKNKEKRWKRAKRRELRLKYKEFKALFNAGELDSDEFKMRFEELMEEMKDNGLKYIFRLPHNKFLRRWWNSPGARAFGRKALGGTGRNIKRLFGGLKWTGSLFANMAIGYFNLFGKHQFKYIPMQNLAKKKAEASKPDGKPKTWEEKRKKKLVEKAEGIEEKIQRGKRFLDEAAVELKKPPFGDVEDFLKNYKQRIQEELKK